jgi:hypothetical protein
MLAFSIILSLQLHLMPPTIVPLYYLVSPANATDSQNIRILPRSPEDGPLQQPDKPAGTTPIEKVAGAEG